MDFGYFAKDVALELEVTTSTLRRWSIGLEKYHYVFSRNDKDQRIYYERDFKAFRELKKLIAHSVPVEDALKAVASMDLAKKNAEETPSVYTEMMRLSKRDLDEIIQASVKKALEEEREILLDAFEQKMNNALEIRDRQLTMAIKHSLETKQAEIAAAQEDEKKKSWWKKIFSS